MSLPTEVTDRAGIVENKIHLTQEDRQTDFAESTSTLPLILRIDAKRRRVAMVAFTNRVKNGHQTSNGIAQRNLYATFTTPRFRSNHVTTFTTTAISKRIVTIFQTARTLLQFNRSLLPWRNVSSCFGTRKTASSPPTSVFHAIS